MEEINRTRLFIASCVALSVTSMTFAVRAKLETVFGPEGIGFSLEQLGYAFGPAFWGFTIAILIAGSLVDKLGIKKIIGVAFTTHFIGILLTLLASSILSLLIATLFIGIGNGFVEAACNPLVASIYSEQKTKMINRFHVWFPGGVVIGSLLGYLVLDVFQWNWQIMVGILFLPLLLYGFLFLNLKVPQTERVKLGISNEDMWKSIRSPLFLFMGFCMLMTAATELGTNQRIESLFKSTYSNPLLILAFINIIMALGRLSAGSLTYKIMPSAILLGSSIFAFIGLTLFTFSTGAMVWVAAAVFALGIMLFWPTMISFVAEYIPESGAIGLSIMGGLGNLSVSIVLPVLGIILDGKGGSEALRILSLLPAILIFLFAALHWYMKNKEKRSRI